VTLPLDTTMQFLKNIFGADPPPENYVVHIHEMNRYADESGQYVAHEFEDFSTAKEYARRYTRASVEEVRKDSSSPEELKTQWFGFGAGASVSGGRNTYSGSDEIDFFIATPASAGELDYQSLAQTKQEI
jgi:hypothetical protein